MLRIGTTQLPRHEMTVASSEVATLDQRRVPTQSQSGSGITGICIATLNREKLCLRLKSLEARGGL